MLLGGLKGGLAIINLFIRRAAGDAMVFDAGETASAGRGQVWFHIIEIKIEPDVAVEIAVARVPGIAFVPAPDLPGGLRVAAKSGDAAGREEGRKSGVMRLRLRVQDSVRVGDEPADICLLQDAIQAFAVSAFRQP